MATLFSTKLPTLQMAWDATSLSALARCPRYYQYAVLEGWREPGENTHLDFGVMAHEAMEYYDRARFEGKGHDEAQMEAVGHILMISGGYKRVKGAENVWSLPEGQEEWKPWGGQYMPMWRCTATEPYGKKGKSGGKLKCPNAKAHVWWPGHGPQVCPECFSPIQEEVRWLADNPVKNRATLVRTVVWWTEELKGSPLRTLALPDGKPMVEVNFQVELPWHFAHPHGPEDAPEFLPTSYDAWDTERFVLCGYWDGGVAVGSENFLRERKTTKSTLNKGYWQGFAPNMQIDTYSLAVRFLPEIAGLGFRGVLVEATQALVGGNRFGWQQVYKTEELNEEHLLEIGGLLEEAVTYALKNHWPMRKSQCPTCPMKKVCKLEPGKRQMFLEANYVRHRWNPLEER